MANKVYDLEDWALTYISDHKFGRGDSYQNVNNNVNIVLQRDTTIRFPGGEERFFPKATKVAFFRPYGWYGRDTLMTFFMKENQLSVCPGLKNPLVLKSYPSNSSFSGVRRVAPRLSPAFA